VKSAAPPPPVAADPAGVRHARRLGFLERLAAAGMEKARGLVARAAIHLIEDFERITKAIRLAILLRRRLEAACPWGLAAPASAPSPTPAGPSDPDELVELAEMAEAMGVAPRAERDRPDRDVVEPTGDPWLDRADALELDTLPVAALVRRLCEILDVPFDPELWADGVHPIGAEGRAAPTPFPPAHPGAGRGPGKANRPASVAKMLRNFRVLPGPRLSSG
jgi:hypothetical protein